MKSLELINILSLGNVVVSQPYENQNLMLKNYFLKAEAYFLDQIQDEETRNLWIKEFVYSIDSLDSFNYKELNYIFKNKIFKDQDQKNAIFQKIRENSKIYKTFQEQKNKKSRRGKRSLFTEYQRLTIQDWIDIIQTAIDDKKGDARQARSDGTSYITSGISTITSTFVGGLSSPFLFAASTMGLYGTIVGGGQLIAGGVFGGYYYNKNWYTAEKLSKKLTELKRIFRIIKTSNNTNLEEKLRKDIKQIIDKINELTGDMIDFDDFDNEKIIENGY
ncbi:hypothetical protein [Mesomycoplasma hyopneumoniae]|uniref:Uncharacterized protein n=3 Tax=Mesomycoplasma hyopneumoniae TaxID=2099 RepID=Q4AAL6_MESHJ|nr:hypothetical protein [Mesomycoplasma hyopneumoniae]AAV27795.1 conserved hypothetical protein [Mesomycoplasma hyopneumoniae 232]AAZ44205.1 conserved hypothetical protein [Mesomycoplasma hyopneumoniae J]MCI8283159.1 hypothetical protein [Mesomycoplasma hyopneumoniae]MCI8298091.1 hypothetical protein [Mesomycoplasma hyopneumoniae]NYN91738.1 hypothetical protein [Mesomycoplasma hyopneumoniae]